MSDRVARAHRAQYALDEFITPILAETRDTYARRIVEIAATELNRDKRADKITALSTAIRVLDALEDGMKAVLLDGAVAQKDRLRADKIEEMSKSQRRLFGLVPH
jgi:hypothetical protein